MTKPSGQYIQYNYKVNSEFIDTVATNIGIRKYNSIDPLGRVLDIVSEDNIQTVQTWSSDQLKSTKWIDSDGAIIGQLDFNFRTDLLRLNSVSLNGEKFLDYGAAGDNIKGGTINDHISCNSNSTLYSKCQTIDNLFSSEYSTSSDETTMTTKSTVKVNMSFNEPDAGSRYLTLNRFNDSFGQATTKAEDDTYYSTGEQFNSVVEFGPTYDANGRLAQSKRTKKINGNSVEILSSISQSSYAYPANSNNNIKEYVNDQKRTVASHKNDDSLIKLAGSINRDYEFDIDGNLKSYTNCFGKTEFEYDIFSNLKKVTLADGKKIEYKVDGFNRRIKKIVNGQTKEYYLWYDQLNLAAVLDENKIPKVKYIYAPDSRVASLIEKNGILYKIIHEPGLDSVRYVINTVNSEIVQEIEYDEQGNMLSNTNVNFQPLGYAGGLYDNDTKLTRFGARDYDPTIGRWTTKDPIGLAGGDTNLYAYVGGNPMSYVDPSGLLLEEAIAKRFTPKQQAAIGAAASTAGAFLMYGSFNPFAPVTFSVGAYLGYEGGANLIKANNRKFIDDVMNDVIPKNSIDDLINPGAKVNLCLMK